MLADKSKGIITIRASSGLTTFATRVDPDTEASPKKECPMYLAAKNRSVATMVELAKYTEPDNYVRTSNVWDDVEKELNWRKLGIFAILTK